MNYYIQGDAAKAEQIKAAFKELGISIDGYDFSSKDVLYFTYEEKGETYMMSTLLDTGLDHIIKTHPDYQELELPVEPKFKKWDWIACDADSFTLSIKSVKDGNYFFHQGASLPIKDIDEHYHLWTIKDAKDGDVLAYQDEIFIARIARGLSVNVAIDYDCCYDGNSFILDSFYSLTVEELKRVYPATKEQRDLLFKKMKEAGYEWDKKKKELRKIKPHYDIANFKPFDKVLVRDGNSLKWTADLFSYIDDDGFVCTGGIAWRQCIPFNDETKHLLGTTDMCDEQYINW